MNIFRTYQRPLMVAVTVVIGIAFILLYNSTQFDRIGADRVFQIYGQSLKQSDIERAARRFQLAQALGLNEMIYGLAGNAMSQEQAMENFVWNSFVLTHEARRLGVQPTDSQVAQRMKELPGFQTNDQFDPMKYQQFIETLLMPNGFTSAQLEDLVRDELRLQQLVTLIGSTVEVSPAEFRTIFTRGYQKTHASLVRFNLEDFVKDITPTDEQIASYYENHKASLTTAEKRIVSFVEIGLNDEEQKLTGRERVEALSRQSDRAEDFSQELLKEGATFAATAEKMGFKVVTTEEFALTEPAEPLKAIQGAPAAAFALTEEVRESNPLESENGVVILHLDKIVAKRPLSIDEAKPRIVEAIKEEQGRNNLTTRANEARTAIAAAVEAGKSFEEAAQEAGVQVESFPAFSLAQPAEAPGAYQIIEAATELPVGTVSNVVPTPEGALIVHLDKRDPIDEAQLAEEQERQIEGLENFRRYAMFGEWLREQLKIANPHSLQPQRQVENVPQEQES